MNTNLAQWKVGQTLQGYFRVHQPQVRTAVNGREYMTLILEDHQYHLRAHLWRDSYQGDHFQLNETDRVFIVGRLKRFDKQWIVNIERVQLLSKEIDTPLALIPPRWYGCSEHAMKLGELLEALQIPQLRGFVQMILNDDNLVRPFLKLPASARHHHAFTGGLLAHSLECASIVAAAPGFSNIEKELGVVAALFHDLGKIRTQGQGNWCFQQRMLLAHEIFTLELLAPYLKKLDGAWPEGGLALRYLLSWKPQGKTKIPAIGIAELVRCADRLSAGKDRERQIFSQRASSPFCICDGVTRFQLTSSPQSLCAAKRVG